MIRKGFFIMVLLVTADRLQGQIVFNTVEDIWRYADAHNVNIRNAGYEVDKAHATKKQSYLAFLPQVNATAQFVDNTSLPTTLIPAVIFGGPEGSFRAIQFGTQYIYTAGVTAQMDIVNLQTWYNTRIAKESEELNRASLGNAKKAAYQQIATQYYSYLLNKEAERLATQSVLITDSVLQSVTNKFAEGSLSLASVDLAQLNNERAQQTEIAAQYQMLTAANTLKGLLNLSVQDSLVMASPMKGDLNAMAQGEFSEDPAIVYAARQANVSLGTYKAAKAGFAPTLSLLYSNTTQHNDNTFTPLGNGLIWYPAQYWSLKATWNIFTAGTRWLQTQRGRINYYESELQLDNAKKQSAINDENIRLSYQKALAVSTKTKSVMNLSYDNYRHISNRYDEGLASLEERLNAYSDYISYQNLYLNSLSDMLVQLYLIKIRQQQL